MCGLFGLIHIGTEALSEELLKKAETALQTLTHRGPDQWGQWVWKNCYSGHRRLSILDLSPEGRQPMAGRDDSAAITVNGEIYNYQELRREIGIDRFGSQSDSEVVLHGYCQWGLEKLLEKMDGMYALAIIDPKKQILYLARDRAGIKPLYYALIDDFFVWSSELKAIRTFFDGLCELRKDSTASYDFLTYGYIPTPKTMYQNIYKLPAAHSLSINMQTGRIHSSSYWQVPLEIHPRPTNQLVEELRSLMQQSVRQHMISDVPIGFFLSGGIDSSIVTALASQLSGHITTYCIGYDHPKYNETSFARILASRYQTHHIEQILSCRDSTDLLDRLYQWYDEPFADTSALPSYHVSGLARQSSTVVLTGDGGDELFGGYRWYRHFRTYQIVQKMLFPPSCFSEFRGPRLYWTRSTRGWLRKIARRVDLLSYMRPLELYAMLLGSAPAAVKNRVQQSLELPADYDEFWYFRKYDRPELSPRTRLRYLDFHTYLPDDILTKVDRVSMAVSLEARVPYLARKVIEFAFTAPEMFIYRHGWLKGGLKYAFSDLLPPEIRDRKKKGFSIPLFAWRDQILRRNDTIQEAMLAYFAEKERYS